MQHITLPGAKCTAGICLATLSWAVMSTLVADIWWVKVNRQVAVTLMSILLLTSDSTVCVCIERTVSSFRSFRFISPVTSYSTRFYSDPQTFFWICTCRNRSCNHKCLQSYLLDAHSHETHTHFHWLASIKASFCTQVLHTKVWKRQIQTVNAMQAFFFLSDKRRSHKSSSIKKKDWSNSVR